MRPPSREDVQAAQSHLVPISRSQQIRSKNLETLCDIKCYHNAIVIVSQCITMWTFTMYHRSFLTHWYHFDIVFWGSTEVQDAPAPAAGDFLEVQEYRKCQSITSWPSQDCITRSRQSSFGIRVAWRFIAHLEAFDGRAEQRLVQSQQRLNSFDLLFIWILHGTVCAFVYVWCCYILIILSRMSTEASSSSTFQCLDLTVSTCFDKNDMFSDAIWCKHAQFQPSPSAVSLGSRTQVWDTCVKWLRSIQIDLQNLLDFDTLWHNTSLQALLPFQICNLNDWSQSSSGSTAKCLLHWNILELFDSCYPMSHQHEQRIVQKISM